MVVVGSTVFSANTSDIIKKNQVHPNTVVAPSTGGNHGDITRQLK
jgi:hypothetical protein